MLIGGAGGGQAGYDGEQGQALGGTANLGVQCMGGDGGAAGAAGARPKVLSYQVASLAAYYDGAAIGTGGAGGASNGALGSAGGATTLGGMTSADGAQPIADVVNFLDGTVYAYLNEAGEAGNNGGIGSGYGEINLDTSTNGANHICTDGTWYGGAYDNGNYFREYVSQGTRFYSTGGCGGGGAAHGANGSAGLAGYDEDNYTGVGGAGGTPTTPTQAAETQAGHGGHGGGGGGGCTASQIYYSWSHAYSVHAGTGGAGGLGSAGGQGGDGLIVIYYDA